MSQPETIEASNQPGNPQAVVRSQDAVVQLTEIWKECVAVRNSLPRASCEWTYEEGRRNGLMTAINLLTGRFTLNPSHHAEPRPGGDSVDGVVRCPNDLSETKEGE